ncbi:MAG: aldehyde dehydrogenase family protein [Saccharofermentanales bacterium]
MNAEQMVQGMISKARIAQKEIENYSQDQVDAICKAIAKVVYDNAVELAEMAVEETGMGRVDHKITKNRGKAKIIWADMKDEKSVGIIDRDPLTGITKVAKPMGVVGAITPTTNPIVTPMCNAMFAVKGRNAVIISPHPRSKKCSNYTVQLINQELAKMGVPKDLIQCIEEPTVEASGFVMKLADVCISTGGMGMVRAAYSSGKPAFGVGAGNVQCIIDRDVDFMKATEMIVAGREFDHGIICSCEQTSIVPADNYSDIVAAFIENGAFYIEDPEQVKALRDTLFPDGIMNKDCVGQSAFDVAGLAKIDVPQETRILLVKADTYGKDDLLSKEKMCPVNSIYAYDTWEKAVEIANANLEVEGKGHTVCIHSNNTEHIEYAAQILPVSRFCINQICATSNGGSFVNGLAATTTLGCGSWGNNSISENLSFRHLFNVSRIATVIPNAVVPGDEEIWEN